MSDIFDKQMSVSQSLFQVYYLGAIEVDRRCSSAVIPWLIEELKLKLQNMNLVWVTLGPTSIDYVADSGEELHTHTYDSILRCSTGLDNVSFAYITVTENKSHCHVFQCLDLLEAEMIIKLFKFHCVSLDGQDEPIHLSGEKLTALIQQTKKRSLSLSTRQISRTDSTAEMSFPITYCGCMGIKIRHVSAATVDGFVSCLTVKDQPTAAKKHKKWRTKRRSNPFTAPLQNSMFHSSSSYGTNEVDFPDNVPVTEMNEDPLTTTQSLTELPSSKTTDLKQVSISDSATIQNDQDSVLFQLDEDSIPIQKENSNLLEREDSDPVEKEGSVPIPARPRAISDITSSLNQSHIDSLLEPQGTFTNLPHVHITGEAVSHTMKTKSKLTKTYSDASTKKKRNWFFGTISKGRSTSSLEKHGSNSSLKSDDSNSLLAKKGSPTSSLRESDSSKEVGSDRGESPTKEERPSRFVTAPTPATRLLVETLESSVDDIDGEREGEGEEEPEEEGDTEFDVIPELQQLQQEPEFAVLGGVEEMVHTVRDLMSLSMSATIKLSGTKMSVSSLQRMDEENSEVSSNFKPVSIVECGIRQVLGCAQGINSNEYLGFITRDRATSSQQFHLVRTVSPKAAANLIKGFKTCFDQCVALSIPNTLCDSCPIHYYNSICKSLNDLSLSDILSKIHALMMSYLTDSEYSSLVKEYKSDQFENEHSQLVRWLVLLRTFFHRQQSHHSHKPKKKNIKEKKGKKTQVLKTITGSFDNLHSKQNINSQIKGDVDGLQSYSATYIGNSNNKFDSGSPELRNHSPLSSPALMQYEELHVTWDISREGSSEANTPDIEHERRFPSSQTFPPPELRTASPSQRRDQRYIRFGRPRTDSGGIPRAVSPLVGNGHISPTEHSPYRRGHQRSMSWRQQIFESVTPSKNEELMKRRASIKKMMETSGPVVQQISFTESIEEEGSVSARAKQRWKWAIQQQILLIRLERENQSVIRETMRHHKINYSDPGVDDVVMGQVWQNLLEQNEPSSDDLLAAIKMGVPPKLREKVWKLLVSHYQSCHPGEVPLGNYISRVDKREYDRLCEEYTEYESVITADIGRTYPTHPFFSLQFGHGRTALYNILHAYAVADKEVGYCQGLSFVAGLIILHSAGELEAFELLSHFMYLYGFRDVYSLDMFVLQIKLYQFSRLLHDLLPNLHSHLEEHDVTSFLYAAPWFLTVFSSQYPIPFVARIMDLVLYEGVSAVFKVGLAILIHYQYEILELDHIETITDFIKITIPQKVSESISEILHTSAQVGDLTIKLQTFETEYHVMHELMATFHMKQQSSTLDMETMNELLRKQNRDLIEQLAVCRGAILRLDKTIEACHLRIDEQQHRIERLEYEREKEGTRKSHHVETHTQTEEPYPSDHLEHHFVQRLHLQEPPSLSQQSCVPELGVKTISCIESNGIIENGDHDDALSTTSDRAESALLVSRGSPTDSHLDNY